MYLSHTVNGMMSKEMIQKLLRDKNMELKEENLGKIFMTLRLLIQVMKVLNMKKKINCTLLKLSPIPFQAKNLEKIYNIHVIYLYKNYM